MKKDDLLKLGIDNEDTIKEIFALHGKSIEALKSDLSDAIAQKDQTVQELQKAQESLSAFADVDIDGLKNSLTEWETKYNELQTQSDEAVKKIKFDTKLELGLRDAKVRNAKAILPFLDQDKLVLNDDGEIEGLTEQLDAIKESNDYLFESDESIPHFVKGGDYQTITPETAASAARAAAGLEDTY